MPETRTSSPAAGPEASGAIPQRRVSRVLVVTLSLAQFGMFVGIITPITVSLAIKTQTLVPGEQAAVVNGNLLAVAALCALVAQPMWGRLSDLTTSRYGRRRPWMVAGAVGYAGASAIIATAPSVPVLLLGCCLGTVAGAAVNAGLMATLADQVPPAQRGSVSANFGMMQSLGILAAAYLASLFVTDLVALFLLPAALAVVLVLLYCAVLPDRPIDRRPDVGGWGSLLRAFWLNPVRHPDFAWAWLSRFFVILAYYLFIVFRPFYLQHQIGLSLEQAFEVLAVGVALFTAAVIVTAKLGGWLTDRTGRRKVFVVGSLVVLASALALLSATTTVTGFYLIEVLMGAGYGTYVAVDTALVVDVLPRPDQCAKDLGLMGIATTLPQSLGAALGGVLLGLGTAGADNYDALLLGAGGFGLLGALAILPIRSVR